MLISSSVHHITDYVISSVVAKHQFISSSVTELVTEPAVTEPVEVSKYRSAVEVSNLDQAHFTNMAYASGLEVINHLNLSYQLNYITKDDYGKLRLSIDEVLNKLNGLYKYQINRKTNLKDQSKSK